MRLKRRTKSIPWGALCIRLGLEDLLLMATGSEGRFLSKGVTWKLWEDKSSNGVVDSMGVQRHSEGGCNYPERNTDTIIRKPEYMPHAKNP